MDARAQKLNIKVVVPASDLFPFESTAITAIVLAPLTP